MAEATGGPAGGRSRTWAHAALIALAVAACYANSLAVPFHWDDEPNIVDHPCGEDLSCYFRPGAVPAGRVVGFLTFWLDRRLHGLDPVGFHLSNGTVHLMTSLLVYALARAALRAADPDRSSIQEPQAQWAALAAALVFACHPVQTQAVTYIVQRLASLAAAFYLASLLLYVRSRQAIGTGLTRGAWLAGSLLCALLAMRTKEIAFTLPIAVAIFDLGFLPGPWRRRALTLSPMLATLPAVPLALFGVGRPVAEILSDADAATRVQTAVDRWEYFATQCRVVVAYLRLLALPVGQNVDAGHPPLHSLAEPAVLASAAALAALLGLGAALLARARAPELRVAGFGVLFFFVALAVESSFIPIVDAYVEHRLYLPSAGAALVVAGGGLRAWRRAGAVGRRALAAVAAAWIVALGVATVARNRVWADGFTLWSDAVAKAPWNPRGHYNVGNALRSRGDLAGAQREWREAVRLAPGFSPAWSQIGNVALLAGDTAGAAAAYRRAIETDARNAEAVHNLAMLMDRAGRLDEAIPLYRRFVEIAPHYLAPQVAEVRARFGWPAPPAR